MNFFLHLENGMMHISGATKIVSSTQTQAVIETENDGIIISGSDIEVKGLDLEKGETIISGKFSNIKFSKAKEKKIPFVKRIFK